MFTLRRFVAPRCSNMLLVPSTTTATFATSASLLNNVVFQSSNYRGNNNNNNNYNNNNNNNNRNRDYNNNNNNNRNNNNNSNNNSSSSANVAPPLPVTPTRMSGFSRNGEAFCDISSPADSQAQGYRLIVAFPTTNCNFMDIQYAPQVRDKSPTHALPAAGETPENLKSGEENKQASTQSNFIKTRLFGMPVVSLTVRLYPLQMAKVVSVLEGKSSEAVIASRLAVGTFKRNSNGSISYAIQTRVPKPEENQPTSIEVTLSPVEAFMLEKFFGRMLVVGFDPSRDQQQQQQLVNVGRN
jgi:hypothetical protein